MPAIAGKKAKNGAKDDHTSKETEKESEETDKKGRFFGWIRDCGRQKRR